MKTGFKPTTYYKLVRRFKFSLPFIGRVAIDFRKTALTTFGRRMMKKIREGYIGELGGFSIFETPKRK